MLEQLRWIRNGMGIGDNETSWAFRFQNKFTHEAYFLNFFIPFFINDFDNNFSFS